jgi:hypothetical protein
MLMNQFFLELQADLVQMEDTRFMMIKKENLSEYICLQRVTSVTMSRISPLLVYA